MENKSLTGTAFLNRFDVLMQLNETSMKPKNIEYSQLLQPKYLESVLETTSPNKLQSFYRGMVDPSSVVFQEEGLRLVATPLYTNNNSVFTLNFKLQIYNERTEKLIMMSPRLDHDPNFRLIEGDCFLNNLEIGQGQSNTVSFTLEADQSDFGSCLPLMLEFFLFSKSEFENTINRRHAQYDRWKKKVVFPVNLLKFLNCETGADFGVVSTLKLNEEIHVNNQGLFLRDLQKLFPNLGKCCF
jgi:hypothetical protein